MKFSVGLASLIASVAYAAPFSSAVRSRSDDAATEQPAKLRLVPVSNANRSAFGVGRHVAPTKNLDLAWKTPDEASLVSVNLLMRHPAVTLEDIDDVAAVDCIGQTRVAVTFSDKGAFDEALTAWSGLNDSFVMVTNHQGDCDAELERSFFVADTDTLASFESNLTIIAKAEKSDVHSTADSTEISFNSVATATNQVDKRGISLNKEGLTIAYDWALPSDQTIVDTSYVKIQLNKAEINNSVTYAGHLKWELLKGVTDFTIDIDKSMHHHANLTIEVDGVYDQSWSWSPAGLTYSVIDIPGILSLGPSAGVSIGGEVTATAGGAVTVDMTSAMPNGSIHMDMVHWDQSTSYGWTTEKQATYNTTEQAQLTLKPFIDFTVEFACELFGGLLDLSTGVTAEPAFPFITTATATQYHNATGGIAYPNSTETCANGLSEEIDFVFTITAFATQFLSVKLYEYKAELYKGCLSWFSS
ncbi:putative isoamyl alcohol [Diaporthe ampelina]|uniref:Putative isoamyl alcohol n=1 Tax=Diaporthe ampelina TaxID=1214573 RepID=A0A0G2FQU3_9PEZI|nr:putative isoamyl alcohol [Diaporthe ampelina]